MFWEAIVFIAMAGSPEAQTAVYIRQWPKGSHESCQRDFDLRLKQYRAGDKSESTIYSGECRPVFEYRYPTD